MRPHFLLFLLVLATLASCSYRSKQVLFKTPKKLDTNDEPVYVVNPQTAPVGQFEHRIKVDDLLQVRFLNSYDLQSGVLSTDPTNREQHVTYLVGSDSTITLPLLGAVKVTGYTKHQLARELTVRYAEFVRDPIIDVIVVSLSVSVMGEVFRPGTYQLTRERTNLVEVLAQAGSLTSYGKPRIVKIIRGDLKNPEIIVVDLTRAEALESEKLVLRDKDIVYVEPVRGKIFNERVRPYVFLTSILSSLVTVTVVILRNNR